MEFAGFWRRFFAYWIDALPITLLVLASFYFFFGFDATLERYWQNGPRDPEARAQFLRERNQIRNLSLTLYFLYSALMEATPLRGSLGKYALRMEVVGPNGQGLHWTRALRRNFGKSLSFLVFGLGCLWVAWSRDKRAWHDYLAGSYVLVRMPADSRHES